METGTTILVEPGRASLCLYVFSPTKQDRLYQLQREKLSDRSHTLSEHDVRVAEVFEHDDSHIGDETLTPYNGELLRQQFRVAPGQFKIVLVSDSAVKLSAEFCVSCEEVIMRVENEPTHPKHSL